MKNFSPDAIEGITIPIPVLPTLVDDATSSTLQDIP
jgi:hypothetical protein